MGKVESLHGATAAEIFSSGLDNIDKIEGVALSVLWSDGSISAGWSNLNPNILARMVLLLDERQRRLTISTDQ